MNNPAMESIVFGLDIGTRNIVGVVANKSEDAMSIVDYCMITHDDRAMYDGQIHDIEKVVKTVKRVTQLLIDKTQLPLERVAIAAAGRALKTNHITVGRALDRDQRIDKTLLDALEVEGLQDAQVTLDQVANQTSADYYCVGYSVVHYKIDDIVFSNPIDHQGSTLTVDMIATFLPKSVVNSLYTVVEKAGLSVMNLTLEPIAAAALAIPEKFRLLNIALVDIGAGTSDIALSKDGTIFGYAMVDQAGDEITEALVKHYLLDFDTAETLKMALASRDTHTVANIVGMEQTLSSADVLNAIDASLNDLVQAIATALIEANGSAPSAVFLIGGGSRLPNLADKLADALKLAPERVVMKDGRGLSSLKQLPPELAGPEFVTPLGICYHTQLDDRDDFLTIYVNGKALKLFNSKQLKVLDALVLLGYNTKTLLPKRGASLIFTDNGQTVRIKGTHGEPAHVTINKQDASLDTALNQSDSIDIDFAVDGQAASSTLAEYFKESASVQYNDQSYALVQDLKCNGHLVTDDYAIRSGDTIVYTLLSTLDDFAHYCDIDVNQLTVNARVVASDYLLQHGDAIAYRPVEQPRVEPTINRLKPTDKSVTNTSMTLTINGEAITIHSPKAQLIFVDIFEHYPFDITRAKGILQLTLNGKRANYTDVLSDGDVIEMSWQA